MRMASKRKSRKRRSHGPTRARGPSPPPAADPMARGYARSRARNEEARAALEPLAPGERPAAVTVGAVAAVVLAAANLIALAAGYNAGEETLSLGSELTGSIIVTGLLLLIAYGMWKARYWAVLGMQTLLAITIIFSALALVFAVSLWAALLVLIILVLSGTLFWFLVKAMARIQMPERPGR
jgi:cation transport ATPase